MRPFRAVPCDHCRFRAVAEDFSVQVDTFRRRVALPDVLLAHPYSSSASRPTRVPRTSGLYLFGRFTRWLPARESYERMAGHPRQAGATDIDGQRYGADVSGAIFSER